MHTSLSYRLFRGWLPLLTDATSLRAALRCEAFHPRILKGTGFLNVCLPSFVRHLPRGPTKLTRFHFRCYPIDRASIAVRRRLP